MKKALIQGTRICDIVDEGNEFEVHPSLVWVEVADDTTQKDTYEDGKVVKPTISTEDAWKFLRLTRNNKLFETDWRAMPDLTLSDAWKTYRQELRDMTKTLSDDDVADLEKITWPTEPS